MRKAIDTAPRNGVFVLLEDAARGTVTVARWSAETAQWLDEDGRPSQLNATHWHPLQSLDEVTPSQLNATYWHSLTPAQSVVETADGSLLGPSKRRIHGEASRPASDGMTAQPQRAAEPGRSLQAATLRSANDEATRIKEASARATDKLRQALQQAQDKAEKLAGELAVTRQEVEAQTAMARAASDEARQAAETSKRSVDDQGQALREAQGKAEKLTTELAAARREVQSQISVASSARDEAAALKEATERGADEQRRALQQERDKRERLATELSETKSSLEPQAKAKAAEEAAWDNQLAAVRGELQKAKAEATAARDSLEAERTRTQRVEQQLATIQASMRDRSRSPPAASTADQSLIAVPAVSEAPPKAPTGDVQQPTNLATRPTTNLEQGSAQAVRLIARANLLLEQGNIGAARNMLDRAVEMGSAEALFWMAETYDPLLLSTRKTFGTQSDIAKARELYGKALASGVSEAKVRLQALQQ